MGFIVGLLEDALTPASFGAGMLSHTLVGYLSSWAKAVFFAENVLVNGGLFFVGTWLRNLILILASGKLKGAQLGWALPGRGVVDPGEFAFEGGPEGLDRGVVVAVAGGTERLVEFEFGDALGEGERCVDRAAVGVVHDAAVGSTAVEGHDQRVGHEIRVDGDVHCPSDDSTRPQVDDRGQM